MQPKTHTGRKGPNGGAIDALRVWKEAQVGGRGDGQESRDSVYFRQDLADLVERLAVALLHGQNPGSLQDGAGLVFSSEADEAAPQRDMDRHPVSLRGQAVPVLLRSFGQPSGLEAGVGHSKPREEVGRRAVQNLPETLDPAFYFVAHETSLTMASSKSTRLERSRVSMVSMAEWE